MRDNKSSDRPSDPNGNSPGNRPHDPPPRTPDDRNPDPRNPADGFDAPAGKSRRGRVPRHDPPEGNGGDSSKKPTPEKYPARPKGNRKTSGDGPRPGAGKNSRNSRNSGNNSNSSKDVSKDLSPILRGWDYEGGAINVRKVAGLDGAPKLQMRVDLGVLQMELTGRPDGLRPNGCESLLDYHEGQLAEHLADHGNDLGFSLTPDQCQSLREEAGMYYHRYLSLFVLGEFAGVVRDTARNLRLLDLCGKFAIEEHDRLVLEQYRPYIIMMHTRASASLQYKARQFTRTLETIGLGLEKIREFFARFGHEEAFARCGEVRVLKRFAKEVRRKVPVDPVQRLQSRLERAVREERYEEAAKLRDQIREREASKGPRPAVNVERPASNGE